MFVAVSNLTTNAFTASASKIIVLKKICYPDVTIVSRNEWL